MCCNPQIPTRVALHTVLQCPAHCRKPCFFSPLVVRPFSRPHERCGSCASPRRPRMPPALHSGSPSVVWARLLQVPSRPLGACRALISQAPQPSPSVLCMRFLQVPSRPLCACRALIDHVARYCCPTQPIVHDASCMPLTLFNLGQMPLTRRRTSVPVSCARLS